MEYFKLNNGIQMPMAGIGVFLMSPAEAEASVESALRSGVCLIDTANGYMNESGTGSGIKKSGVPREESSWSPSSGPPSMKKRPPSTKPWFVWVQTTLIFYSFINPPITGVRATSRLKRRIKKAK